MIVIIIVADIEGINTAEPLVKDHLYGQSQLNFWFQFYDHIQACWPVTVVDAVSS